MAALPFVFEGLAERLPDFMRAFVRRLKHPRQQVHAQTYVAGLVSNLERKNTESIAYRHNQDRQGLQRFLGAVPWDHQPLLIELARQVGQELGEPDGVLVFDPSGFPKKGTESVGVRRQWLGRLGKIDNGQVGVYLGYVSRREQALVDMRLYLPQEWAADRKRRKKCGVPRMMRFRTRQELALEMLTSSGHQLPHAWVAGDDEMGRSTPFRRALRELNERYLLGVPCDFRVRHLDAEPPPYAGRGPYPQPAFQRIDRLCAALSASDWKHVEVRAGEQGPLEMDIAKARVRVRTRTHGTAPEETLVLTCRRDEQGQLNYDYYLSNAAFETTLEEFARVANAQHRIEQCIQRAKSEAGLADYEVRTWWGWHHHQALSLLATWFLVQEARRGKKYVPALTVPQVREAVARLLYHACGCHSPKRIASDCTRRLRRNEQARFYRYKQRQLLAPLRINQRR